MYTCSTSIDNIIILYAQDTILVLIIYVHVHVYKNYIDAHTSILYNYCYNISNLA